VVDRQDRRLLINAAPGAEKTIAACAIAQELIEQNEIDRVVVIAPRAAILRTLPEESFARLKGMLGRP
jgi:superfamily II DNA or RNA helicase